MWSNEVMKMNPDAPCETEAVFQYSSFFRARHCTTDTLICGASLALGWVRSRLYCRSFYCWRSGIFREEVFLVCILMVSTVCCVSIVHLSLLLVSMAEVVASVTWLPSSEALVGMPLCRQSAEVVFLGRATPLCLASPQGTPWHSGACESCGVFFSFMRCIR